MLHSLDSAKKRLKSKTFIVICRYVMHLKHHLFLEGGGGLHTQWQSLGKNLKKLKQQIMKSKAFAFSFDEVCTMYTCMCANIIFVSSCI